MSPTARIRNLLQRPPLSRSSVGSRAVPGRRGHVLLWALLEQPVLPRGVAHLCGGQRRCSDGAGRAGGLRRMPRPWCPSELDKLAGLVPGRDGRRVFTVPALPGMAATVPVLPGMAAGPHVPCEVRAPPGEVAPWGSSCTCSGQGRGPPGRPGSWPQEPRASFQRGPGTCG